MATRLLRDELLTHPIRSAILDRVRERPGVAFLELFHLLKSVPEFSSCLGYGSLSYHLHQLERFGYLVNRKTGRHRRYYASGGPQGSEATALSVLQGAPVPDLAHLLLDHGGATQRHLWRRFRERRPCTRQTVGYHLARLERHGLVTSGRCGRGKAYWATEKLRRLLPLAAPAPRSETQDVLPGITIPSFEHQVNQHVEIETQS